MIGNFFGLIIIYQVSLLLDQVFWKSWYMFTNEITLLLFCQVEWHDYRYAILLLITESEKRRVLEGFVKTMKLALFTISFFFFLAEIVHEILDIKNMTRIYFSWDQNQDVAIWLSWNTKITYLYCKANLAKL